MKNNKKSFLSNFILIKNFPDSESFLYNRAILMSDCTNIFIFPVAYDSNGEIITNFSALYSSKDGRDSNYKFWEVLDKLIPNI